MKKNDLDSYDRTEDITPEEVRQFEKFTNYTNDEQNELIKTIKIYVRFIYNVCSKREKKETEKLK